MKFPGTTLAAGSADAKSVSAIQKQLVAMGCGPVDKDGVFGAETFAAVEHLQARFVDTNGQPLTIDGKVGPTTWAVLFGATTVATMTKPGSSFLKQVLAVAGGEVGTMEDPLGSNRGPKVDEYIRSAGLDPAGDPPAGYPWCMCFVYWCFQTAAAKAGVSNPCFKTGSVLAQWTGANTVAGAKRILPVEAQATPSLIVPGTLFLLKTSGVTGHIGFVESTQGNQITTIEGNTNDGGSREGIGVFRRATRTIPQVNLGFVLYG